MAAGHTLTAEAGAEVLREGGNAVDACIAAACMSWVTESTLTSPGGGGFLLVRQSSTGRVRLHDFFIAIPGQGLARPPGEMEAVDVEFDRGTSQIFRIGGASVGVPGAIAGLEAAHRAYATLPWRRLLEPAIAVAREGHVLTKPQAFLHAILDVILRRTETGREIFGPEGVRLVAGDRLVMPDLAATLELLADEGAAAFYGGELGRRVSDHVRAEGGSLTQEDLAEYRVISRRPIRSSFDSYEFVSNPPPSSGGILIAYALQLLSRLGPGGPPGSAEAIARLAEVMREQTRARGRQLHERPLSRRAREPALRRRRCSGRADRGPRGGPGRACRRSRDDPHLGRRRRRQRRLADRIERLRLGRDRARHRHPPEQHARRVRPQSGGPP